MRVFNDMFIYDFIFIISYILQYYNKIKVSYFNSLECLELFYSENSQMASLKRGRTNLHQNVWTKKTRKKAIIVPALIAVVFPQKTQSI